MQKQSDKKQANSRKQTRSHLEFDIQLIIGYIPQEYFN